MLIDSQQLDQRFTVLHGLMKAATRPASGWIRAIRDALGMTTAQLAARLDVAQSRISEMEKAEATGSITLRSLERAAEALGCRLVYVMVPFQPLAETMQRQASKLADQRLALLRQTMRLEDQDVSDAHRIHLQKEELERQLLSRPARLWDEFEPAR